MTDESLPVFTLDDLQSAPRVELARFTNDDAVALGVTAASVITERNLNLAVDVVVGDDLVFRAKLGSTGPGNDQWLAGKAVATRRYGVPSLLVRRREEAGEVLEEDDDMKIYGGSIPIFVGGELVATITMSGEPDVVDHATCAAAVDKYVTALG